MASSKSCYKLLTISILLISFTFTSFAGNAENADVSECKAESGDPSCHNNKIAQKFKLIAIPSILVASMIGVSLPLFARSIPALGPDRNMFVIITTLASGVILATGFMHVLPDAIDCLKSKCLPEDPWQKFSFATFIAMVSTILVLMIDAFSMCVFARKNSKREGEVVPLENGSNSVDTQDENQTLENESTCVEKQDKVNDDKTSQLLRNKVIAQVHLQLLYFFIIAFNIILFS